MEATTNDRTGPYLRRNDRAVRESREAQLRVSRRWKRDRARLWARAHADPERVFDWQLERVRALVDSAYATVPFYRDLYRAVGFEPGAVVTWSDFEHLPVVSKKVLVEAGALRDALESGSLAGAAFDGYYNEPIPDPADDEHGLLALDQVFVTSHIAASSVEAWTRMENKAFDNLIESIAQANAGETR